MWNPVSFSRPDLCPKCNNQGIEIYDYFGHPLNYRHIIDRWMNGLSNNLDNKYPIYIMKCKNCGCLYNIIWNNDYPLPDFRSGGGLYKEFIDFYIKEGELNEIL